MAKKKPSALEALRRLDDERRQLESRGADVRRAAALELGFIVLDAGGASLGSAALKALIRKAVAGDVQAGSDAVQPQKRGSAITASENADESGEASHG